MLVKEKQNSNACPFFLLDPGPYPVFFEEVGLLWHGLFCYWIPIEIDSSIGTAKWSFEICIQSFGNKMKSPSILFVYV
jgi:hypothetical protein